MQLPNKFVEEMKEILNDSFDEFNRALDDEAVKALRVDVNKMSTDDFKDLTALDIEPIEYINGAFFYKGKIGATALNHAGFVYSQDVSAMLPAIALGVEQGDIVLDVCAAPGGKSIQILQQLNNTGLLISNEYVYSRAKVLYENVVRFGYRNCVITNNLTNVFDNKHGVFDKILVDAPCSGEGMFRKGNTFNWNEKDVQMCAVRQLEILDSVCNALRPGGKLVYSTCTYNRQENEKVVVEFLKKHKDFHLCPLPQIVMDNTARGLVVDDAYDTKMCGRRYPHQFRGEGQFVALLCKVGDEDIEYADNITVDNYKPLSKKDSANLYKALSNIGDFSDQLFYCKNDNIYAVPRVNFDYSSLNVLSLGVFVGNFVKGELKLSHSFYKAYGYKFHNTIDLDDNDIEKYFRGETITIESIANGIVAVKYKGVVVGGGKAVGGVLKNYYPKELRNK